MRRAIELQHPFVPGPPPKHSAQARANWRWFRALQDAIARGLSDRAAVDEANAKVPEALEPTDERDGGAVETSAARLPSELHRQAPRRSLHAGSSRLDARVIDEVGSEPVRSETHELILPLGSDAFELWPGRPVPLE